MYPKQGNSQAPVRNPVTSGERNLAVRLTILEFNGETERLSATSCPSHPCEPAFVDRDHFDELFLNAEAQLFELLTQLVSVN